jgi:hypothetical protein
MILETSHVPRFNAAHEKWVSIGSAGDRHLQAVKAESPSARLIPAFAISICFLALPILNRHGS